jgi:NMT1/THI5 like
MRLPGRIVAHLAPYPTFSKCRSLTVEFAPFQCSKQAGGYPPLEPGKLLRADGFTDVSFVPAMKGPAGARMIGRGEADFTSTFAASIVLPIDEGEQITALAGVHRGCYELFASERIRSIVDLKGKRVGVPERYKRDAAEAAAYADRLRAEAERLAALAADWENRRAHYEERAVQAGATEQGLRRSKMTALEISRFIRTHPDGPEAGAEAFRRLPK